MPAGPGCPLAGIEAAAGAFSLARASYLDPGQDFPPLFVPTGRGSAATDFGERTPPVSHAFQSHESTGLRLSAVYLDPGPESERLIVKTLAGGDLLPPLGADADLTSYLDRVDLGPLDTKQVDLLLVVPADFVPLLEQGGRPPLIVLPREGDERSRLVQHRFNAILARWKKHLKQVRLIRQGLPVDFDEPFEVLDRDRAKPSSKRAAEELFELLVRIFPFVLVMWSLAGALYPAVDVCAGEKERGTMETLLISPASREEIVWGKFLTIWVFSGATALLNLLSMGLTTWQFSRMAGQDVFRPSVLGWGILLLLPLSAFFSALCLSVGVYARSSKEGQYYLMPLFLLTMPLIFLTLAPGVELNPFYSMVPVTGVALLLQKLMAAGKPAWEHGLYVVAVLAPMAIYCWLALRWAILQFQREEVLFREAERIDVRLWLKHLFRDKELLPTTGEAMCCFGLILTLRWLSLSLGRQLPTLVREGVGQLAFVAAPPLFMTLMLTRWPRQGVGLRWPPLWSLPLALLLGLALVPPLAELTLGVFDRFPTVKALIEENRPLAAKVLGRDGDEVGLGTRWCYFLVLAVLPAGCEEVAFRGFILTGLTRRFRPATALFISAFLYAVYPMNLFYVLPHFVLGLVFGYLVLRTNSVLPAVLAHLSFNAFHFGVLVIPALEQVVADALAQTGALAETSFVDVFRTVLTIGGSLAAASALVLVWFLSRQTGGSKEFPTITVPEQLSPSLPPAYVGTVFEDRRAP